MSNNKQYVLIFYGHINPGNIKLDNLCRDGLHLGESGKKLLLDNSVKFLYIFLDLIEPYQTLV